jgi:exodeoxyribonuclease VII large subunit
LSQLDFSLDPSTSTSSGVMTVSEAVRAANRVLEHRFSRIWVEGEVSNLKVAASGHAFFTLKDDEAALPAAMWRSSMQRLRFQLEEGQRLRVFGRLGIYDRQGRFQLYVERAEPAGLGELMAQLEQLKAKLSAEGLFDADRKRPLPPWPRVIGVVTSPAGAAIHDVIKVARRRCPSRIVLSPAVVQGDEAPASLVDALDRIQRTPDLDVVIIGRGGGSVEDLWAFNDEALARAVAAARVPVVSAVGHEIDVTLCDLVADLRAATPSHGAELVVPDRAQRADALTDLRHRLERALRKRVLDERGRLERLAHGLGIVGRLLTAPARARLLDLHGRLRQQHPRARLARDRRRLDVLRTRLVSEGQRMTRSQRLRLARAAGKLEALSPLAVMGRGYAVVTDAARRVLTDAGQTKANEELEVRLYRGRLRTKVLRRLD